MKLLPIALALTLWSSVGLAKQPAPGSPPDAPIFKDACQANFTPFGMPVTPGVQTTTLCRQAFLIKHHDLCKAPLLVAERLRGDVLDGPVPRDTFRQDPDLPVALRSKPRDYKGFDMGHLAPAANFHGSSDYMRESFYLSNASPQAPKMNRVIWRQIELKARKIAKSKGEIFVITGVVYEAEPPRMNGVCVGTHFYKAIFDRQGASVGYLVKNVNDYGPINDPSVYRVTVSEIERMTGFNFTPTLPLNDAAILKGSIYPLK